eukprot:1149872-Pelagomonas_calceolata.AAC.4
MSQDAKQIFKPLAPSAKEEEQACHTENLMNLKGGWCKGQMLGVTKEDSKMKCMLFSFVLAFLHKQTNDTYRFISDLMDIFMWLAQSRPSSQTTWLK